jgi:patatin-like phospholipase/acyl hydrolase
MNEHHHNTLVLDGGGVRGLFTWQLLKRFIEDRGSLDDYQLVVGVSVGAMIAALVAFDMMNEDIMHLIPEMFQSRNQFGPVFATKYNGVGKTNVIRSLLGRKKMGEANRGLVIVTSSITGRPCVYTSWDHPNLYISEVVDASSAAPVMFPPVRVDGLGYHIDGGVCDNRPLLIALMQSMRYFSKQLLSDLDYTITSIGTTGTGDVDVIETSVQDMGLVSWLASGLIDITTGTANTTQHEFLVMVLGHERYFRVESSRSTKMDDFSHETLTSLILDADDTWKRQGQAMVNIVQSSSSSSSVIK